jgi:predicted metal-dependent hydrolase
MATGNRRQDLELPGNQIEYVRSLRAKCLRITVKPGPKVNVTIPRHGTLCQAEEFVRLKMKWILKTIERLARIHPAGQIRPRQRPAVTEEMIGRQDVLFDRLKTLAAQHGFRYQNIGIRNQKTRWGSCSSRNNISLNIHLLNLPDHLRDYVILHELVHTEHKNHSSRFWIRLDEVTGGVCGVLRKEMRKYRI